MKAQRLQIGECLALGRCDVRLADVGVGIEDVIVGRRDVEVAGDERGIRAGAEHFLQRREPRELVLVVVRVGLTPVRDVYGDDADAAARGRDCARFGMRKTGSAGQACHHVFETYTREDRDAVPGGLTVSGCFVAPLLELVVEQLGECVVGKLRLLQADHVRLPLVEPWQEPGHALLDRVDVPGGDSHRRHAIGVVSAAARGGLGCRRRRPSASARSRTACRCARRRPD